MPLPSALAVHAHPDDESLFCGGMTGHPDHVHAHRITALAVRAAGLPRYCPESGDPWQPSALHLATHPRPAAVPVGGRLARPGTPADALYCSEDAWITTTVDVGPWFPQKLAAILAHRSGSATELSA